jgi:hypothetical protein
LGYAANRHFAFYCATSYLHCSVARTIDLSVGYDGNVRVWLNGTLINNDVTCDSYEGDEVLVQDV